jgi:hypothetical protein
MAQITLNSSGVASNGSLLLQSNGTTTALTIDASQSLGLGVTPSAWASFKPMQISTTGCVASAAFSTTNTQTFLGNNVYYNAGFKYIATGSAAALYNITANEHRWNSAAIGTAGNAISFTNVMCLDTDGNLLVGPTATTSGAKFYIKGNGTTSATYNVLTQNSAGNMIFATEDGGTVYTGNLTDSPYNATTAAAANVVVGSGTGKLFRSTSSLKYKREVENATHGLSEVLQLRPVTYKGKGENDSEIVFGGLIAEEVHEAGLTEFVQYAEDGSPDALAYGHMVSLCVKAIQELNAKFEAYKASHS